MCDVYASIVVMVDKCFFSGGEVVPALCRSSMYQGVGCNNYFRTRGTCLHRSAIDRKALDEDVIELLKRKSEKWRLCLSQTSGTGFTLLKMRCKSLVMTAVGIYVGRGLAEEK
jgi:hypothetical protein